jgi:sporulation protein YlmC with PRC-barrel domain
VIRLSQLKGQRVLAQNSAQIVGSVRRLQLDAESARIVAIELEGVADGRNVIEWPAVASIGRDALIVGSDEDRRGPLDEAEQAFVAGQLELEGKLVLDDAGDAHGKLLDVAFDEKTGRVVELDVPGHVIPVDRVIALGSYALIVPAPA